MNAKVEKAIETLKRAEKMALELNPEDGFYVAFSGGKDSQCVLELVKMAGVRYKAWYSVTGIDSPQNIRFIRQNYGEVGFVFHRKNFIRLIEEKGLPMMNGRFCCERLKEKLGAGNMLVDGVRAEESKKRAGYSELTVRSRRKENKGKGRNRSLEEMEMNEHRCIKGKDRIDLHIILEWTEQDVWRFIFERRLPINPTYGKFGRVGCMVCPFASRKQVERYMSEYPLYRKRIMIALERFLEKKRILPSPEVYFDWWLSNETLQRYKERNGIE